ncbi:MAG: hypothetical protein AB8G11_16410 [Saprospiraceae bacterium]
MNIDFRHTNNDPDYEKVQGLRKSRSLNFKGNWGIFIGIITLPLGIGIIILALGIYWKLQGKHLKVKYKE